MTVNSAMVKVAEWTDEGGFNPVAAKYTRLKPAQHIERNKTYIVTTIEVFLQFVDIQGYSRCWYIKSVYRAVCNIFYLVEITKTFIFLNGTPCI